MNPILGPLGGDKTPNQSPSLVKITLRLMLHFFAPFVGAMIGLFVTYKVEMTFIPVVTDFKVTELVKEGNAYKVTGSYNKHRSCELLSTSILAINENDKLQPAKLLYQIKHQDVGANLPVGRVSWGPYLIPSPPSFGNATKLTATSLHRCHALWLHESHYITLPIAAIKGL